MKISFRLLSLLALLMSCLSTQASKSVFTQKPRDPDAVYFSPQKGDVTAALQKAINDLKDRDNYGIVYFAPGTYHISNTIYVPASIRLIGWGKQRPQIVLSPNSPGYDKDYPEDEGHAKYMFWFVGNTVHEGEVPLEATSSTFYQAFENIDVTVGEGNPQAVVFRTHYAQHSFIEHADINIGNGKAGIFDAGNEIEDVTFHGGEFGIYTRKTSPGWQFTVINSVFDGQRHAAIRTMEAGMTLVRVTMKNSPIGLEIWPKYTDVAIVSDCLMDNISKAAIMESGVDTPTNQLNVRNTVCRNTPVFLGFPSKDSRTVSAQSNIYRVDSLSLGLTFASMASEGAMQLHKSVTPLKAMPQPPHNDIPQLPDMSKWTYITDLGAVGDGKTDNTQIFRDAINKYDVIFLPQGLYVIKGTLKLRPNTVLIGMDPVSTRIVLPENTPGFSGFGSPVPLIESSEGGKDIITGIGLDVMGFNYRVVGCKWMAGKDSYINDVHFSGWNTNKGPQRFHSQSQELYNSHKRPRIFDKGVEESWDNQHWNLWVTNNGGGVFKDIWLNNTFGSCGLFVDHTSTPGRIYEMSVEHHLRNEVVFDHVSNWDVYALQLEEETREGNDVVPMELSWSHDIRFYNFFVFRVISIVKPLQNAVRTWNCNDIDFFNLHNFTQMRYTINNSVYDENTMRTVHAWELARLTITGKESKLNQDENDGSQLLARGFEYAEGITHDGKGNVYFSEGRLRKVFRWDATANKLGFWLNLPWEPLSLATDTKDNLLVVVKYYPQPGNIVNGQKEDVPILPDSKGTTFSWWGNFGFLPLVYTVPATNPSSAITILQPQKQLPSTVSASWYATHRWRDLHDFDSVCQYKPEYNFIALDGTTVIPQQYDLLRSSSIVPAYPGKPCYQVDEFAHRVMKFNVNAQGSLSNPKLFAQRGENGVATDDNGNVYIAEGDILVYDANGNYIRSIHTPEAPNSLTYTHGWLYYTTHDAFYRVRIQ